MKKTAELKVYAEQYGIVLDTRMCEDFEQYSHFLLEWNQKINLTALTDPHDIVIKHFLDSILVLKAADFPQGASLLDVGTGAGFPAVPLKIVRPDLKITLLDSTRKRTDFLTLLSDLLNQNDNQVIHARAEEAARDDSFREQFDFVAARAVAGLPALSEYCLPFVRPGGCFLALKAARAMEELHAAKRAVSILGGTVEDVKELLLPDGDKRGIILIRKISQTSSEYPRKSDKIKKLPL